MTGSSRPRARGSNCQGAGGGGRGGRVRPTAVSGLPSLANAGSTWPSGRSGAVGLATGPRIRPNEIQVSLMSSWTSCMRQIVVTVRPVPETTTEVVPGAFSVRSAGWPAGAVRTATTVVAASAITPSGSGPPGRPTTPPVSVASANVNVSDLRAAGGTTPRGPAPRVGPVETRPSGPVTTVGVESEVSVSWPAVASARMTPGTAAGSRSRGNATEGPSRATVRGVGPVVVVGPVDVTTTGVPPLPPPMVMVPPAGTGSPPAGTSKQTSCGRSGPGQ